MDICEVMDKRFSVRKYKRQPVEEDKLQRVLNAGRIAPSASNRLKWKFVVVRDGKWDDLPEQAFLYVGTIEDAVKQAEQIHSRNVHL